MNININFEAQAEIALNYRSRKSVGYWTNDNNLNVRIFLDEFAKNRNFDPLIAENWLPIQGRDIIAAGGVGFLGHYRGSLSKCLVDIYQDTGIKITHRNKLPQGYWKDITNRRQVFDNYAKRKSFDPLLQKNWFYVTRKEIFSEQGGSSVMDYYDGSMGKALKDIYPTVYFHEPNFFRKYWHSAENRRKFFDNYACASGFDPKVESNWYSATTESVVKHPGGYAVMEFHHSLLDALQSLYPEFNFDESKFNRKRCGYWNPKTRRKFFDEFAQEQGFDPLIVENWYNYGLSDIHKKKGSYSVMRKYSGSLNRALVDLYPDLHPDPSRFSAVPGRYWKNPENQKMFLTRIASERGLDPLVPNTWKVLTSKVVKQIHGGRRLLDTTGGLEKALAAVFPNLDIETTNRKIKTGKSPSIWDRVQ